MIEYHLHTGRFSTGELYHNFGLISNGIGSIKEQNPLITDITINGQSLLETVPEITIIGQQEIINNSGDFFLSGGFLRETTGYLDLNFPPSNLRYDFIKSGSHSFFESDNFEELTSGYNQNSNGILDKDIFLNGIKLVSGEHYTGDSLNRLVWADSLSTGFLTGILFDLPQKNQYYQTGFYDITGINFNKDCSVGYLNGVKINKEQILETSILVEPLINVGLNAVFDDDSIEQEIIYL